MKSNIYNRIRCSFENKCLKLLVSAYEKSIANHDYSNNWMENDFTSMLDKYINENELRRKWEIHCNIEYHFHKNELQLQKGYANKENRIDMKMSNISQCKEVHFFIEAKRLKECDSKLQNRYIDTGIDNFLNEKYPKGILIGYLVQGKTNPTIEKINKLLIGRNRGSETLLKHISPIFDSYFKSTHEGFGELNHYIFDYTYP